MPHLDDKGQYLLLLPGCSQKQCHVSSSESTSTGAPRKEPEKDGEIDVGSFEDDLLEGAKSDKRKSRMMDPVIEEIAKLVGPEVLRKGRNPVKVRLCDVVQATTNAFVKNTSSVTGINSISNYHVDFPSHSSSCFNEDAMERYECRPIPELSVGRARLVRCQICACHRTAMDMQRLAGKFEKSAEIVRYNSAEMDDEKTNDLLVRISRGATPYVCKKHIPQHFLMELPAEVHIIPKYRSKCFVCGISRHHFDLRQISTLAKSRSRFYEYNNLGSQDEKRTGIETKMENGSVVMSCVEHFPPENAKRVVRKPIAHPRMVDENERLLRVALPGDETFFNRVKRKQLASEARREGRLLKSCHWCEKQVSVKEMRGMPNVEVAIEKFFEHAKGSREQENSLRKRIEQLGIRHCRVCYEHFPKEWAHARGRYWYVNFFGSDTIPPRTKVNKRKAIEDNINVFIHSYAMVEDQQSESDPLLEPVSSLISEDYAHICGSRESSNIRSPDLAALVPVASIDDQLLNGEVGSNVTIVDEPLHVQKTRQDGVYDIMTEHY